MTGEGCIGGGRLSAQAEAPSAGAAQAGWGWHALCPSGWVGGGAGWEGRAGAELRVLLLLRALRDHLPAGVQPVP